MQGSVLVIVLTTNLSPVRFRNSFSPIPLAVVHFFITILFICSYCKEIQILCGKMRGKNELWTYFR